MVQTRSATARGQAHEDASPAAKRQRQDEAQSPKKQRRKRRELCQLNLDVLFLIAEYVHPMDLLNLARTCRSLRELLMGKSSEFVWKTARHQVRGLPDCPSELTEPEYANLVFCARCHGCGKPAKKVLWRLRRRYCQKCKAERLCNTSLCDEVVRNNYVLPEEHDVINDEKSYWVDKDQMKLFLDEYHRSADKKQLLNERKVQLDAIGRHAYACENWQKSKAWERRVDLGLRRDKREESILDRLRTHGYGPEIGHVGTYEIRRSNIAYFRKSKPLTDKEWDMMLPEWQTIMDKYRTLRLTAVVYRPRLQLLGREYDAYAAHQTLDESTFDILPHLADLSDFGPFQNVIKAPEGTQMGDKPFASAFTQLPKLIEEWKRKLGTDLAELVKIPLHLCSENSSGGPRKASGSTEHSKATKADLDKLQLACALFRVDGTGCFTYLDALSVSMRNRDVSSEHAGSFRERFRIGFLEEAPYIVHTCGLDPNTATVDDMDRRDAKLRCLSCHNPDGPLMNWRCAMWHVGFGFHGIGNAPLPEALRWQLVSDDDVGEIQIKRFGEGGTDSYSRCLLCQRRVADAASYSHSTINHLVQCHNIAREEIKDGVHYAHAGICYSPKVKVVEDK